MAKRQYLKKSLEYRNIFDIISNSDFQQKMIFCETHSKD
jgi:hypothetical protein